jgi:peptidoglycan/LPS O-acetylase OafA/YrhL
MDNAIDIYENLGKSSLALFFMVCSFLFYGKILTAPDGKFDWPRFTALRLSRLTPPRLCAITFLIIEVVIASHWHVNTNPKY